MMHYQKEIYVRLVFNELNKNNIRYILIKNIENELPSNLPVGKDIDLIVYANDKQVFRETMKKIAREMIHPYTSFNGWSNLYGLLPFEFWRAFKGNDLYVDICYELCCKGLIHNSWIPLDNAIQEYAWKNRVYDQQNNWWMLDCNTRYIYYIVRCMFDKEVFSDRYIREIIRIQNEVDGEVVVRLLRKIYFDFTPKLLDMIENKEFDHIRDTYISYVQY